MNLSENVNGTEEVFYFHDEESFHVVPQIVFYTVLFLVGVPGNVLVLVVLNKRSTVSPVVNVFLLSLAVADLGVLLLYAPFYLAYEFLELVWPFGLFMCKFVFTVTHVFMCSSLSTMVGIAIERYCVAIRTPMKESSVKLFLAAAWLFSFLVCIPDIISYQLVELEPRGKQIEYACDLVWPNKKYEQILQPIDTIFLYLTPLCFITVIYVKIICKLRKAYKTKTSNFSKVRLRHIREALRTLITIVSVFALCLFPIHLLHFIRVFFPYYWEELYFECPWLFSVCAFLVLATHAANPVIYGTLNRRFRREATLSVKLLFMKAVKLI